MIGGHSHRLYGVHFVYSSYSLQQWMLLWDGMTHDHVTTNVTPCQGWLQQFKMVLFLQFDWIVKFQYLGHFRCDSISKIGQWWSISFECFVYLDVIATIAFGHYCQSVLILQGIVMYGHWFVSLNSIQLLFLLLRQILTCSSIIGTVPTA